MSLCGFRHVSVVPKEAISGYQIPAVETRKLLFSRCASREVNLDALHEQLNALNH